VPTRKYRTPRVFDQTVTLAGRTFRQLFIEELGHDEVSTSAETEGWSDSLEHAW
jgi:hypothetical protein